MLSLSHAASAGPIIGGRLRRAAEPFSQPNLVAIGADRDGTKHPQGGDLVHKFLHLDVSTHEVLVAVLSPELEEGAFA